MRAVLLALLVACGSNASVHDVVACGENWGLGSAVQCELACENKPYNQDSQPDTGSGNSPETCSAWYPARPSTTYACSRVFYARIDGVDHRGCCDRESYLMRFLECCTYVDGERVCPE